MGTRAKLLVSLPDSQADHVQYNRAFFWDILRTYNFNFSKEGSDSRVGQCYQWLVSEAEWHLDGMYTTWCSRYEGGREAGEREGVDDERVE